MSFVFVTTPCEKTGYVNSSSSRPTETPGQAELQPSPNAPAWHRADASGKGSWMSWMVITIANGSGGDRCAAVSSEVSAACMDLLAVHAHRFRRLDPKADPVAFDRDHDD